MINEASLEDVIVTRASSMESLSLSCEILKRPKILLVTDSFLLSQMLQMGFENAILHIDHDYCAAGEIIMLCNRNSSLIDVLGLWL